MKRQYRFSSLILAGQFFMGIQLANAQYEDGSLAGTIRDSSGAVVARAAVSRFRAPWEPGIQQFGLKILY
jgi:hypothetical protein